jgi:hypothetical protein
VVLALCILGLAAVTLLVVALVDRPKHPTPGLAAPAAPRSQPLDPYVMR